MMLPDTRFRTWVMGFCAAGAILIAAVLLLTDAGGKRPAAPGRPDLGSTSTRPVTPGSSQSAGVWQRLEDGLELGVFESPQPAEVGDGRIRILRIDPARFELRLLCATASAQGRPLTARQWCEAHGLVAAINAGMYQKDHRTSTAFMRTSGHTNNPQRSKDNSVLAWDPLDPNDAPVRIADLEQQDFQDVARRYGTLVQSIRMVTAEGRNAWSPQPKKWSAAAIGMDRQGRVLFIHVRSPYRMHDLIDRLLGLPIDLAATQYAEGGPEAQLYIHSGQTELECIGSYETGFWENDDNQKAWPVPNVVGIARRRQDATHP